ncbi:MAG: AAA family ATPase [Planctomycetes bacterium]|nr:AAA family ATPase [Planctomycetota bacterium]
MEGVPAAAREFLSDTAAVEAYLEVDRRREAALHELHDAFISFRDADESIHRLVKRIRQPLWEVRTPPGGGAPVNLWGFQHEDERLFAERFAGAAPRVPDVDLASLFRSYLQDEPRRAADKKVQLLLAFGEFVAGLDARAEEGEPRLGVGPAANFLTFAWHCLSMGAEPVFLYAANRATKALDEAAGSGEGAGGHLERRFTTFFALTDRLGDALAQAPAPMRRGWAIEHALEWLLERLERGGNMKALLEDPGASGLFSTRPRGGADAPLRPVIVAPSAGTVTAADGGGATASVRIERPKIVAAGAAPEVEPRPEAAAPPLDDAEPRKYKTERLKDDETRARQRARIGELSKRRVVYGEPTPIVDRSGAELAEVLPPDRTPPHGLPRPGAPKAESAKVEPPKPEPVAKVEPPKPEPVAKVEPPKPEPPRPEPARVEPAAKAPAPDAGAPPRSVEPWWAQGVSVPPPDAPPRAPAEPPRPPRPEPTGDLTEELDAPEALRSAPPVVERAPELADDESADVAVDALLGELRGEVVQASRGEPPREVPPDRLAHDLFLDPTLLAELQATLNQRGRALLVGPPWAGKTHVARRLAIHLAGHLDRVLFLRLHPALTYADLMGREPGLVRAFCERAREDRDQRYVLVLDELDAGDAAQALGELTGALAERGQDVQLGTTGAAFHVPRNLLVLATARSLPREGALVGRLPAVRLPADPEVLRRYLAQCRPAMEWVADLLRTLNERLDGPGDPARVGHGVFMDPDLDADRVRLIFRLEIGPLLEAHGIRGDAALELEALRPGPTGR